MEYLKKVLELTTLAMTYQKDGIGQAFINFSGHTHQLDIRLFKVKWTGNDNDIMEVVTIYLEGQLYNERRYLRTIIWLQNCLLQKDLLSSNFIYEKENEHLYLSNN